MTLLLQRKPLRFEVDQSLVKTDFRIVFGGKVDTRFHYWGDTGNLNVRLNLLVNSEEERAAIRSSSSYYSLKREDGAFAADHGAVDCVGRLRILRNLAPDIDETYGFMGSALEAWIALEAYPFWIHGSEAIPSESDIFSCELRCETGKFVETHIHDRSRLFQPTDEEYPVTGFRLNL